MNNSTALEKLNRLFGSYKAEWLSGQIFDLFTEPAYFPALKDNRPCVLEGGRGTGKTTVLRGLSYQGQFALLKKSVTEFDKNNFIGIYLRADTNQVRAFKGASLSEEKWMKIFAHYLNLIICKEILVFLHWHNEISISDQKLGEYHCKIIAKSLLISNDVKDSNHLLELINSKFVEFQGQINNPKEDILSSLSMSGVPILIITEQVLSLNQFRNKMIYFLLDEYENFEDYQQMVINSLIKHTTESYTFKIGVRELGWRIKTTYNNSELLHDPADYVLIKIEKELQDRNFSHFAMNVCQPRIMQLFADEEVGNSYSIISSLESVSIEEEAELLGIAKTKYLLEYKSVEKFELVSNLPKLYLFLIAYWAKWHNMNLIDAIDDYLKNKSSWDQRYDNYKYEMLFKIHKGRGKGGIQKYYAGWTTYLKLAQGNIRYLMELIYKAYEKHLNDDQPITSPVSLKNQTNAAIEVGEKNLMELEGLKENGAQIIRLLLGFGRIFNVLSCEEGKSAPEKNQFSIENSDSLSDECKRILTPAVMHLALIRIPGNKLTDETHTRDYIYTIHPIYSAYFVFSYRRKRKLVITQNDFLSIINSPKEAIKSVLERFKIFPDNSERNKQLPIQLSIFENYYND